MQLHFLVLILPLLTILCGTVAILSTVTGRLRTSQLLGSHDDIVENVAPSGTLAKFEVTLAGWLDDAELSLSPKGVMISVLALPVWFALCGVTFGFPYAWVLGITLVPPLVCISALTLRRNQRRKLFDEQFPEAVSLLARSVHAGLSIDQSVMIAADTLSGRIAREFSLCREQLQMGSGLGSAFQAMATRTRSPDVSFLATILSVHREAGGQLAETLDRLAIVLQDKLTMRRQLLASTSAGRFATKLLVPFAPLLFLLFAIVQPEHTAKFFASPLGWTVFLCGLALEVIGVTAVVLLSQPE